MTQYIRAIQERAKDAPNDMGSVMRFTASTEAVARDGLIIAADAWQLDNFRANPVVLANHDYSGTRPPIGRVVNIESTGGKLIADVLFDQDDPYAVSIERKYRNGFMNTVSVGWDTQEMDPARAGGAPRVTKAELLDVSTVNVPGDPGALVQRQIRALQELAASESVDDAAPESATWPEVSAAMVSLFGSIAQRPDTERQREYRRLSREYKRHGKTAPEWMPLHDLEVLGANEIRGLFLEGEADDLEWLGLPVPEQRAGAVLSKRNADDLATAIALITGVMERATKEPETNEPVAPDDTTERAHAALDRLYKTVKGTK